MAVLAKIKNLTVYSKVIGIVVAMSLLVFIVFVHINSIKNDVYSLSSQRDLSVSLVKLTHQMGYYSQLIARDRTHAKQELEKVKNLYDKNLNILKNGGDLFKQVYNSSVKPAPDGIKPMLFKIDSKWNELSENVIAVITLETFKQGSEMATGSIDKFGKYSEKDVFKPLNTDVKNSLVNIEKNLEDFIVIHEELASFFDQEIVRIVKLKSIFYTVYLILMLLIVAITFYVLNIQLGGVISKLSHFVQRIARGNITETVEVQNNDELGLCITTLNTHIINLSEIVQFVEKIGNGNLDFEYTPRSEDDVLGKSLLMMKETMHRKAEEEKKRKYEDELRNWSTQGIAKFGELLRKNNDNLDELAYSLLSNIISYVNATLGGVFILEEESTGEKYFRLSASYAYDRRKYLMKRIAWGEGLVGRSALENKTIHLTELPPDYIQISSGIGNTEPTSILICPLRNNEIIFGVLEIASFGVFEKHHIDFIEHIADSIGATIATVKINVKTSILLRESREQTERLAQQEEEMRQNMEEMQATQEEATIRNKEMDGILSAIDNSSGTYELNSEGYYVKANDNYIEYTGLNRENIHKLNFKTLVSENFKNEKDIDFFWQKLLNGLSFSKNFSYTINEKKIWLQESFSPIKSTTGDVNRIFVLVNDITDIKEKENAIKENMVKLQEQEEELNQNIEELRATQDDLMHKDEIQRIQIEELNAENNKKIDLISTKEEQNRLVLEGCLDGVIKIDSSGYILFFNKSAEVIWGYSKSEVLGNNVSMLMTEEYSHAHDGFIGNYLTTGVKKIIGMGRELPIKKKDGTKSVINLSVIETLVNGERAFTGFVKDMSRQIQIEEEREALAESIMAKEFNYQMEIERLKKMLEHNTSLKAEDDEVHVDFIAWDEVLSVHIEEIDLQHKKLVDLINSLYRSFKEGKAKKELKHVLKDLVSYTNYHFSTEEKYFKELNYEFANEHIAEHRKLVEQVIDFQKKLEAGSASLSYEIMNFLRDWLVTHIMESDKKYVQAFNNKKNAVASVDESTSSGLLIEWDSSYMVGLSTIDSQHKILVDLINQLYSSFKEGKAKKQMRTTLKGLVDYTDYHFGFEERHFKEFKYADQKEHTKEHEFFVKRIKDFQLEYEQGKATVSYEVMQFLRNWLLQHIQGIDKKYVDLFKRNGIK